MTTYPIADTIENLRSFITGVAFKLMSYVRRDSAEKIHILAEISKYFIIVQKMYLSGRFIVNGKQIFCNRRTQYLMLYPTLVYSTD